MTYMQWLRDLDIIPPWAQFIIAMVRYLFSAIATAHFAAMIPIYMKVKCLSPYCKPLAKSTYRVASWLAITYGTLLCLKGLTILVYILISMAGSAL